LGRNQSMTLGRNQLIEIQYSEYVDLKNQTNLDLIIIFYHEDRSILQ
jgi:hypothetical protein